MEDKATVIATILVVLVIICSIGYFVHSKSDCDSKHGVLVRNATGFYSCVEQGKH